MVPNQKRGSVVVGVLLAVPLLVLSWFFVISGLSEEKPEGAGTVLEKEFTVEKKIFGTSTQGKSIEGYEIGSGKNVLLLLGAVHGNEMGTTDLLNRLIEEIKTTPSLVAPAKKLVIIPIVNPDGYYDRTDKLNANEVNLNLNFTTTDWQQYGPEGMFAGEVPFSEIESRVVRHVVQQYKPLAMISFHSQGALVSPEADQASMALAKWYADTTGYAYFDEWDYHGTATRWFTEMMSKPAITVELTSHTESDWEINKKALLNLVSSEALP